MNREEFRRQYQIMYRQLGKDKRISVEGAFLSLIAQVLQSISESLEVLAVESRRHQPDRDIAELLDAERSTK